MIANTNFGMPLGRMNLILRVVSAEFGVSLPDLLSHRRMRTIARPRQIACWLAQHATTYSMPQIGDRLGNRDHTTILHAIRQIEELRAQDLALRERTDTLLDRVLAICIGTAQLEPIGALTA